VTRSRPHGVSGSVILLLLTLVLSGCTSLGSGDAQSRPTPRPITPAPSARLPSPAAGLSGYSRQKLRWTGCRTSDQCARLRVPLDYAKPTGRAIEIALLKVPARDRAHRLGSMVVDPGGPGVSGRDYAAGAQEAFGASLRDVYDIVGLDPRGVAGSTAITCGSSSDLNALVESDPDPDTAAERSHSDQLMRDLGRSCLEHSGALTRHVSTEEVARDLDILRAVLGDTYLTYFGASYGTAIGAAYADLFPRRVGRMVLDGAVDPASSTLDVNLVQAHGFEVALRAYVAACVARGHCFLGNSVDQGVRRIAAFLAAVEKSPIRGTARRRVTAGDASYGVWQALYDKRLWPILDQGLQLAFRGDGRLLLSLADLYLHRNADGAFTDNTFEAFFAISCLDHDDGLAPSQVSKYLPRFEKASPTFGASFAYSTTGCALWPVHSGRQPAPVHATGSPPILVVGTTRDPATPLVWARALAKELPRGVLVTRDGDGHTGYRRGSSCVDSTVEAYLVSGTVPRHDVSCR
jgi:pimeloyl-ACP methyl ester carboxylesterase